MYICGGNKNLAVMKPKMLLLSLVAAVSLSAPALNFEDINPTDHLLIVSQIEREWRTHGLFTASMKQPADIGLYALSFAQAYPNDLTNNLVTYMMGYLDQPEAYSMVVDKRNGYAQGELGTELTHIFQMCYWRCNDGGTLIAVAFEGDEYVTELNEDLHHPVDEDDIFLNINDLMFYYIEKGEVYWLPRTPEQMFGKKLNFAKYSIQLPREGKTITFTDRDTEKVAATYTWNGSRFVEGR